MKYDIKEKMLYDRNGNSLKKLECPLFKKWEALQPWTKNWRDTVDEDDTHRMEKRRYCGECKKCVIDINSYSEDQIIALIEVQPDACVYLRSDHPELEIVGDVDASKRLPSCCFTDRLTDGTRIIQTARSIAAIQRGVKKGLRPFFVSNDPEGKVLSKLTILYNEEDKKLRIGGDFRSGLPFTPGIIHGEAQKSTGVSLRMDMDRDLSPIAAYLIPPDLENGSSVWLQDIIEECIKAKWNQGDTYRRHNGYAIWTGQGFELPHYGPELDDMITFVG